MKTIIIMDFIKHDYTGMRQNKLNDDCDYDNDYNDGVTMLIKLTE